ncbi:MAG: hypothetical protein QXM22_00985, partial [Candidatus Bathyarchaeia archaeon]
KFHDNVKISRIVLVSTSGWWEVGNFGTVVRIAEELAKDVGQELAASILRPHAFLMGENKKKAEKALKATKQAGYQLVKDGRITKETLETISQPLVSEEDLRKWYNDKYMKAKNKAIP